MNITLNLNEEETDALTAKVAARNANGGNYTIESHLTEVVQGSINSTVKESYESAVRRLGVGAMNLPYADRKALIAQVESQL